MENKKIALIFTLFLFTSVCAQAVFAEDLNIKACFAYNRSNSFSIKDFGIYVGKISPEYEPQTSKYTLKILDYSNNVLLTKKLAISFFNPKTNTIQETGETCFELPFQEKSGTLKIFYENKEIFSANLKNYICNKNDVCGLGESQYNCPEDCKVAAKGFPWTYAVIAAACVAVLLVIFFYKKSGKESDWQKIYKKWQ